ncbi:hypothetical protein [Catenulispora pinisilvae]|uniref:hypothetical protein n=1 Tax=Catenulispora pinisilvae TaxID=2705253 RepID=UPI0018926AF7|nr:hypothetical protein [Catenulispora pinisilvae]
MIEENTGFRASTSDIALNPQVGPPLTEVQMARVRLIHETFDGWEPLTLEQAMDAFRRDFVSHRDYEIGLWEAEARAFLSTVRKFRLPASQRAKLRSLLLGAVTGHPMPTGPKVPGWIQYADQQLHRALPVPPSTETAP